LKKHHIGCIIPVGLSFGEFLSKELKDCQKQLVPFLPSAFSLDKAQG